MTVAVYKGRLMGIGEYLNNLRRERWAIAEDQSRIHGELKARVKQLDHALVFLRGGGELSFEQRAFVAGEVGEKLANARTAKERTELAGKLQRVRDRTAHLAEMIEKAQSSLY